MTAAYSVDFREKIVELYERGDTSYSKVAKNFGISVISAKRYVKKYREEGDLSPQKGNQGRPTRIDEEGYKTIQNIIQKRPTITLAELSELYYKEKKTDVGRSVLSRACKKLDLRRKKLSRYAAERDRYDVKKNGKNILK
jgi:transposase